jgi:hypothetical protein
MKQLIQEEYVQILLTVVLTSLLTYWLTSRHEWRQLSIENRSNLIKEAYAPIMKIILEEVSPLDGYEGLGEGQVNRIIKIATEHEMLIDVGLSNHIWSFKEDIRINSMSGVAINYAEYDIDRRFLDYVENEYHKLRKSVGLPYDKNSIGIRRKIKQIRHSVRRSKIYRWYRKRKYKR